jgi:DNA modification methylase
VTPYLQDPDFTLHLGDVREVLPTLEPESVDCALTSPPFFGLRDYGTGTWEGGNPSCDHVDTANARTQNLDIYGQKHGGGGGHKASSEGATVQTFKQMCSRCGARRVDQQIGLEATPEEWCNQLVQVFRQVRRILKPAGTLWVECGDSYGSSGGDTKSGFNDRYFGTDNGPGKQGDTRGLIAAARAHPTKPKDLLGAPWMLAFALRADGWYLRQCIIWQKPNPMPESVRDRCTTAHSYLFLLSKQPRYWFDAEAIAEPAEVFLGFRGSLGPKSGANGDRNDGGRANVDSAFASRNARSVWSIPTQGYSEAHFATWPEALVARILKASCPEQVCTGCGKARERIEEVGESTYAQMGKRIGKEFGKNDSQPGNSGQTRDENGRVPTYVAAERTLIGWSDCGCNQPYQPGVCLDPFMGSGTTALVARRLGRRSIGVELNEDYARMAGYRMAQLSLLATPTTVANADNSAATTLDNTPALW